jgi:hypothetical protein
MTNHGTGFLSELNDGGSVPARAPSAPTNDKESLLDAAIKAGKFAESRRAHYAAMYDKDPKATTRLISSFAAGAVPSSKAKRSGTGLLPELDSMPSPQIQKCSARLRVLLDMARDRHAIAFTVPDDLDLTDEELEAVYLTNALLDIEREHRARQWAALEALLPLIPSGGDVSELVYLPRPLALRAARLVLHCCWFCAAPD